VAAGGALGARPSRYRLASVLPAFFACSSVAPFIAADIAARAAASISPRSPLTTASAKYRYQSLTEVPSPRERAAPWRPPFE
jgi:hypothetical protein